MKKGRTTQLDRPLDIQMKPGAGIPPPPDFTSAMTSWPVSSWCDPSSPRQDELARRAGIRLVGGILQLAGGTVDLTGGPAVR